MTKDVILRWKGPDDAVSGWHYKIYADKVATGTFALVNDYTATTPYAAVKTTLTSTVNKGATSLAFASVTGFANGNYAITGREMFLLGGLASLVFAGCTPGQMGTVKAPHYVDDVIYKAHEAYTDSAVTFGTQDSLPRHVIHYQIRPYYSSVEHVGVEVVALEHTLRPHNGVACVWGIERDAEGNPLMGVSVTADLAPGTDYFLGTAETFLGRRITKTTDRDGYWSMMLPVSVARGGVTKITLTRYADVENLREIHELLTIPDLDAVNFLDCLE